MTDDRELWQRLCRRDAHAFETLYQTYGPNLMAFLRQLLGNAQAAEDVTQETFTQIWQRPNGYEPARGTLRAYILGAGRKRASEWWRKQARANSPAREEPSECIAETTSLMGDAFRRLPEERRTLMWLREVEGYSYAEIAEVLGIPVGTVGSRLTTARDELKAIWELGPNRRREGA